MKRSARVLGLSVVVGLRAACSSGGAHDAGHNIDGAADARTGVDVAARADTGPPVCGDGRASPGEACDDGNTVGGDGCSATCQSEVIG